MNMKKYISVFLIAITSLSFTSCNKLFLEAPIDKISEIDVWTNPMLLDEYMNSSYRGMSNGFDTYLFTTALVRGADRFFYGWFTDQITVNNKLEDETIYGGIIKGLDSDLSQWARVSWQGYYSQIQSINRLFENEDNITAGDQKNRILGEAHFFRAYYYYMLWRQWGGVMLIKNTFDPLKEDMKFARASYNEMVDAIVNDARMAAEKLPLSYESSDAGRITKGAALMLIAKTYMWAAGEQYQNKSKSYLGFIDDQSQAMLEKAKKAYDEFFELGQYNLIPIAGTTEEEIKREYRQIFLTKNSIESILEVQHNNDGNYASGFGHRLDRDAASPYFTGTNANYTPTQNHVDEYGMREGYSYDKNNPYIGRDYRFYANILYDGAVWNGHEMDIHYTDGTAGVDLTKYGSSETAQVTRTGYYMAKFLDETQVIDNNNTYASKQNYIIWRYAEALLDYAEITFKLGEEGTALDYVNQIRERVHMHPLSSITWDDIYNERRVELAFEETQYWDMFRRGEAINKLNLKSNTLKIMEIELNSQTNKKTYKINPLYSGKGVGTKRVFKEKQYYLPLHWDDIRYHGVDQNPDWTEM